MRQHVVVSTLAIVATSVIGASDEAAAQPTFVPIGPLGGEMFSAVNGLSADGSVAVGNGSVTGPFRWTAATGRQSLPLPPGATNNSANAVSPDGGAVAGRAGSSAALWIGGGDAQLIGPVPGSTFAVAYGVSDGGGLVVGSSAYAVPMTPAAFRWTSATGMQLLPALPSGPASAASGISADGGTIVGTGGALPLSRAFRWTAGGGTEDLGTMPGATIHVATAASADGSVIVGRYLNPTIPNGVRAFRWTGTGGMAALPTMPTGGNWFATAVSADGSVVVGGYAAVVQPEGRGWRWSTERGTEDLTEVVAALGVAPPGTIIAGALALSADGRTIGGTYYSSGPGQQAWIGHIPVACYADCNHNLALTVADLTCFQSRFFAGNMYADCNGSGTLTAADFTCYQAAFVLGCR